MTNHAHVSYYLSSSPVYRIYGMSAVSLSSAEAPYVKLHVNLLLISSANSRCRSKTKSDRWESEEQGLVTKFNIENTLKGR